ncbi:MAG: heavy metal-binding domain-containing protein [Moraxellaceae bacterium]|nr:heavy metal-binding domain-containing protein [Moraxellaceae bacterium]
MEGLLHVLLQFADLVVFAVLLALGYTVGRARELSHFKSIRRREKEYAGRVASFASRYPPAPHQLQDCVMVSGCVVVGSDYFKQFAAGLRSFFGGRLRAYENLLDRARREAVLRMKEEALRQGCTLIFNVKVESTNITGGNRGGLPAVEAFAYGTALRPPRT